MIRGDKFSVKAVLDVEILGFFPAGQTNDGKAKYVCTVNGYKITTEAGFLEMLKKAENKEEKEQKIEEPKTENKKGGTKNGRRKK